MSTPRLTPRPLGRTGLKVTPLGLAALAVQSKLGRTKNLPAADVERAFYDHGINTFLVHFLMKDMCEGVRRLIKAGHRDEIVLVSEVGVPFAGSARRGLDHNLRVLGTDHLDVWLVGWVRSNWYVRDGVWSEMVRLRESGKTRSIGISSHDRPLAANLARRLAVDVAMIRYNAAHRGAEHEVFGPLADLGEKHPGIISYTATRWGMLLRPLPLRGFAQPMTGAECYRFVLGHPVVDMAWCAAATADELREDVEGALAGPLDPARLAEVRKFGDAVHATARGGLRWMFGASSE